MSYELVPYYFTHPGLVVLDMTEGIERFDEDAVTMTYADYTLHDLVENTVKILSHRGGARDAMYGCLDGIRRCYGERDGRILAKALGNFAEWLEKEFEFYDLWDDRGFLYFDFHELRGRKLILRRRHTIIEAGGYIPPPS